MQMPGLTSSSPGCPGCIPLESRLTVSRFVILAQFAASLPQPAPSGRTSVFKARSVLAALALLTSFGDIDTSVT